MERLGRYLLGREVRVSDFSRVHRGYLITERGLTKTVHVRRAIESLRDRSDVADLLLEDARLRGRITHPAITATLDLTREDGRWSIVEERLAGQDLASVMLRARAENIQIGTELALHVAMVLLDALDAAHRTEDEEGVALGLVHRDVCPTNVIIGYAGHLKLGGFAYAASRSRPSPPQPGVVQPRYRHLSPEQALGGEVDVRSDLFSVGLILWELLAGQPAYDARTMLEALACAQRGEVRPLAQFAPDLSPELLELVMRAVSFDPAARPASARELRDALAPHLFSRAPAFSDQTVATWMERAFAQEAAAERDQERDERGVLPAPAPRGLEAPPITPAHVTPAPERLAGTTLPDSRSNPPPWSPPPWSATPPNALSEAEARGGASSPRDPPAPRPASSLAAWSHPTAQRGWRQHLPTPKQLGFAALMFAIGAGLVASALSSERTRRLVERRIRAAVVGREPGGTVTFESLPSGARLFIDDEDTGQRTPVTVENLESGMVHKVRLELEGEPAVTSTVGVEAGKRRAVTLTFPGAVVPLSVMSDPPGAEVSIDGRLVAVTPVSLRVRVGQPLEVRVRRAGFEPYEARIAPERGKRIDLDVKLERVAALVEGDRR